MILAAADPFVKKLLANAGGCPKASVQHREPGKHPRTAPDGLILLLGEHGHEPWLTVVTAADRRVGHIGGTAGEDDIARSLQATVASTTGR